MQIMLSPQGRDDKLEVTKDGDILTVNGEVFDFSPLPEGARLPHGAVDCEWFVGDVLRENGELILTLILPHGLNPPMHMAFPDPLINVVDGIVPIPTGDKHED